jgi:cell division protein FtsB
MARETTANLLTGSKEGEVMMVANRGELKVTGLLGMASSATSILSKPDTWYLAEEESRDLVVPAGGQGDVYFVVNRAAIAREVKGFQRDSVGGIPISSSENRIRALEGRVAALEEEVEALKQGTSEEQETGVILLRSIPKDQAKQEIRQLFASGETLYYSDIVQRLGLDIALVVELCQELEAEGEVMTLGNAT